MADRFLYLIRHGSYVMNRQHQDYGSLDNRGQRQAHALAKYLAKIPVQRIYCSTMVRAEQTAKFVHAAHEHLPLQRVRSLRECLPSVPHGVPKDFRRLKTQIQQARDQALTAYKRFFRRTVGEDKHEFLVCHGNIIRYLIGRAIRADQKVWGLLYINHASVSVVRVDKTGRCSLLKYNDVSYLPRKLRSDGLLSTIFTEL